MIRAQARRHGSGDNGNDNDNDNIKHNAVLSVDARRTHHDNNNNNNNNESEHVYPNTSSSSSTTAAMRLATSLANLGCSSVTTEAVEWMYALSEARPLLQAVENLRPQCTLSLEQLERFAELRRKRLVSSSSSSSSSSEQFLSRNIPAVRALISQKQLHSPHDEHEQLVSIARARLQRAAARRRTLLAVRRNLHAKTKSNLNHNCAHNLTHENVASACMQRARNTTRLLVHRLRSVTSPSVVEKHTFAAASEDVPVARDVQRYISREQLLQQRVLETARDARTSLHADINNPLKESTEKQVRRHAQNAVRTLVRKAIDEADFVKAQSTRSALAERRVEMVLSERQQLAELLENLRKERVRKIRFVENQLSAQCAKAFHAITASYFAAHLRKLQVTVLEHAQKSLHALLQQRLRMAVLGESLMSTAAVHRMLREYLASAAAMTVPPPLQLRCTAQHFDKEQLKNAHCQPPIHAADNPAVEMERRLLRLFADVLGPQHVPPQHAVADRDSDDGHAVPFIREDLPLREQLSAYANRTEAERCSENTQRLKNCILEAQRVEQDIARNFPQGMPVSTASVARLLADLKAVVADNAASLEKLLAQRELRLNDSVSSSSSATSSSLSSRVTSLSAPAAMNSASSPVSLAAILVEFHRQNRLEREERLARSTRV